MPTDNITVSQQVASASTAACAELTVGHPLWTIKTRLQNNLYFTLNPRILYRGFVPSAASMMPITSTQMVLNHVFQNMLFSDKNNVSSQKNELAGAFFGGALAAAFACPVEMIITRMETGQAFLPITQALIKQGGFKRLYSGVVMTAMRDGCFGVGYMALPGVLEQAFSPYFEKNHASWLAKIVAGVSSAVVSQAFDTVKTAQQSAENGMGLLEAIKKPYVEHGLFGYLKGGLPRGIRVASAVCIMSTVTKNMNTFFNHSNGGAGDDTPNKKISSPPKASA
jgi:hypothetical protein